MKKLFFLLLAIANSVACPAQLTIKDVLTSMPTEVAPYLNDKQKSELGKFLNSTDTVTVNNIVGGTTVVDSVSNTFVRIRLSKSSDIQIKLLPLNDTTRIVCVVKTVTKPVPDSSISFYSTEWNKLNDNFNLPDKNDPKTMLALLTARPDTMNADRYAELQDMIEPVITSVAFKGKENSLTYSLGLPMLNKAERDEIKAIIKQKSFNWNGKIFNKD